MAMAATVIEMGINSALQRERNLLLEELREWPLDNEERELIESSIAKCTDLSGLQKIRESLRKADEALELAFDRLDALSALNTH